MATVYIDVFQSITRRRLQEEKDEKTLAESVRLYPLTGVNDDPRGPFLKLRPVLERVLAREPRHRTAHEVLVRQWRKAKREGRIGAPAFAQEMRDLRALVGESPSRPTTPEPARPRDTRYNRRLARRRAKAAA
jgi:hypothetical protein